MQVVPLMGLGGLEDDGKNIDNDKEDIDNDEVEKSFDKSATVSTTEPLWLMIITASYGP